MSDKSTLGVVLVNYRSHDDIERRLRSGVLADASVVIVDNGSEPEAITHLAERFGCQVVLSRQNLGFAAGVALGIEALGQVKHLLLLNPDAALTRTALVQLQASLAPSLTGVAPLLVEPDGRIQVGSGGGSLTLWSVLTYFSGLAHIWPRATGLFLTRQQSLTREDDVSWLCAACLLLQGNAFDNYGCLPTNEIVYAEDLAWGTAATARGARFKLITDCLVAHTVGASGGSDRWIGATERTLIRQLGPLSGSVAVAGMRLGLKARQVFRRVAAMIRPS